MVKLNSDMYNWSIAETIVTSRYSTDYGKFRFCIADTEEDWRPGTEQYKFIEHCLSSVDRQKQPWLIFLAHRVLGYSSASWYEIMMGSYGEPMGREGLQDLWQKYKVDLAVFGHIHSYERTCPIYQASLNFFYVCFKNYTAEAKCPNAHSVPTGLPFTIFCK